MTLDWINGLANITQFAIPVVILVWADRPTPARSSTPETAQSVTALDETK